VSRETRWLRLGGIALVMASIGALGAIGDATDPEQLLRTPASAEALWTFAAFAVALNALTIGLVLLLAGLRSLSLRHSRQARRGALARIAATNLLLPCALVATIVDVDAFDELGATEWVQAALLVAFLFVARHAIRLYRSGWKYEALTAEEVLSRDTRPPVVYLRSFEVDDQIVVTSGTRLARLGSYVAYTAVVSPEQEMTWIMSRVGPVVAIGKPGERLPELGAARMYVSDDEWRDVVGDLLARAALVVIRAGETQGVWWEIEQSLTRCPRQKVVIVAVGVEQQLANFDRRFAEAFGVPQRAPARERSALFTRVMRILFPYGMTTGKIVYFDGEGRPREWPLFWMPSLRMFFMNAYSPHGAALRDGFRHVFAELQLPWRTTPTLTSAVLLALFGGVIGLHHFYLGERRKGWWRCGLFWTGMPMLLGIVDAVKLAGLDEEQFRARFTQPAWSHPVQPS
jgi:TM2 domain-containing membrane protein YozV